MSYEDDARIKTQPPGQQYPELADWQIGRIKTGLDKARDGHVRPGTEVFANIAARHGWKF